MCGFCNVWVCVCVGFVMCGCVYVGYCNVSVCVCVFLIYLQHAPLNYYAILHAFFILYIYVVSITFIHLVVTVPFITYQRLLSL